MNKYLKTAAMSAKNQLNGGILYLLPEYSLRIISMVPLMFLWKALVGDGIEEGLSLNQMLQYTYVSALLAEFLSIQTPLTDWLYDGMVTGLYQRPLNIYLSVVCQTLGKLFPRLFLFSLPMALLAPLFGISARPVTAWVWVSFLLCVSLGFAIDFLFASLMIRLMNGRWMIVSLRSAVTWLFSGNVIPLSLLPWNLGWLLGKLPYGSLGGAFLSLYTGEREILAVLPVQIFWNLVLWPLTIYIFKRAQERMVCNGG